MRIGLDVGSTTLKCVAIDDNEKTVYKAYERHYSKIAYMSAKMLSEIIEKHPEFSNAQLSVSSSAVRMFVLIESSILIKSSFLSTNFLVKLISSESLFY